MKIVSYYKEAKPGEAWTFWDDGVGVALPKELSRLLNATVDYHVVKDSPMQEYPIHGPYDIAYCQKYEIPAARPADFVYSFCGDVWKHEEMIKTWVAKVRPNYIGCFEELPDWLVDYCSQYGCKIEMFPWFIVDRQPVVKKDVDGLCSGCVGRLYPSRTRIYEYLKRNKFDSVVLSCASYGNYPLSNEEYRDVLSRSKYYFTGPIRDLLIAPKYREAMNYGAAVVTTEVEAFKHYGFEDGKNIIGISRLDEIDDVLRSDRWKTIGKTGRELVQTEHTVEKRAQRIKDVYEEWRKNNERMDA